jgi:HEXXH motif-containing protein
LAGGRYTSNIIRRLRSAEFSKNVLLMEGVRREVIRAGSDGIAAVISSASEVLRTAQDSQPRTVAKLLTLPNFGLWAADCLIRLRNATNSTSKRLDDADMLGADIGHLAGFAAVAALRTRQPCRLRLPIRDGAVFLPALGRATVPVSGDANWVNFVSDGNGATIKCGSWELRLPVDRDASVAGEVAGWQPAYSLTASSQRLSISLVLEDSDPFLAQLAPSPPCMSPTLVDQWRQRLAEAWQLLTHHHRNVAIGLAEGLTAIIPSSELEPGRPITATSGWAWGAVLLSLPPDKMSFAEALTHEFHHLVLAAVEDIAPLFDTSHDDMCYAPWRDDPRPRSALLQGSYAFFGVAGFWLRQSNIGSSADKRKAQIEFARRTQNVSDALTQLNNWAGLTATGHIFTSKMADHLAELLAKPVPPSAKAIARQANAEHRARWLRVNEDPGSDLGLRHQGEPNARTKALPPS